MEYKVAVQHGDAKLVTALLIEAQCPEHARTTAIIIANKFGLEKASVIGIEYKKPATGSYLRLDPQVGNTYWMEDQRSGVEDRRTSKYGDVGVGVRREWPRYGRRAGDKARWAS